MHRWATEQHESEGVPGGNEDDDPDLQLALAMSMTAAAHAPRDEPSAAPPSSKALSPPLPHFYSSACFLLVPIRHVAVPSKTWVVSLGKCEILTYFWTDISTQLCAKSSATTLDPQKCAHAYIDVCHCLTRM